MRLVATTSSFWFREFEDALDIIRSAGGEDIEVALHWRRGDLARAQHLEGVSPLTAQRLVHDYGLRATNLHNVGGVAFAREEPAADLFDAAILDWLDPSFEQCLVFHLPSIFDPAAGSAWWDAFQPGWVEAIGAFRGAGRSVTVENLGPREDSFVPVFTLAAIQDFLERHSLLLTLDTTQCLQAGFDLHEAARALAPWTINVHLGELHGGRPHAFVGESGIDWRAFFGALDADRLESVTLEFTMSSPDRRDSEMSSSQLSDRLRLGFERVATYLA